MSHNPPVPSEAQSPFPLRDDQAAERNQARRTLAEHAVDDRAADDADASNAGRRWPRYAAGAAIGSAAIAAALLYYNRSRTD